MSVRMLTRKPRWLIEIDQHIERLEATDKTATDRQATTQLKRMRDMQVLIRRHQLRTIWLQSITIVLLLVTVVLSVTRFA